MDKSQKNTGQFDKEQKAKEGPKPKSEGEIQNSTETATSTEESTTTEESATTQSKLEALRAQLKKLKEA